MPYKNKEDQRASWRKWHKQHPEKSREGRLKQKRKIKKFIREYLSDKKCSCGEAHISCLDFHHLDPSEKEINISQAVSRAWSIKRLMAEIKKCIVICSNCHRKLHYEQDEKKLNKELNGQFVH